MPDYVEVGYDRLYQIKYNIDDNKGLTASTKDKSGKVINIATKDCSRFNG